MPATMPKMRLYNAARRLSSAPTTDFDDLGRGVSDATSAIVSKILRSVEPKVTAAATVGATQIDILRFHGNDLDEVSGFPMLTLVKGPRDTDLRAVSGPTLIEALQEELAPFEVYHSWHSRSNMNRIILRWHDDVPLDAAGDDADGDGAEEEDTEEEEEEDDGTQGLLLALKKQLAAVEDAAAGGDPTEEYLPYPLLRRLPEIPEEEDGLQDIRSSLQSLLRALQQ